VGLCRDCHNVDARSRVEGVVPCQVAQWQQLDALQTRSFLHARALQGNAERSSQLLHIAQCTTVSIVPWIDEDDIKRMPVVAWSTSFLPKAMPNPTDIPVECGNSAQMLQSVCSLPLPTGFEPGCSASKLFCATAH
jgi:hypothetical protein